MRGCCVTWGMGRHSTGNFTAVQDRACPRQGVVCPIPRSRGLYTPDESAVIYGGIEISHCGSCVAVGCCVIVDHSVILVVDAGRVQ